MRKFVRSENNSVISVLSLILFFQTVQIRVIRVIRVPFPSIFQNLICIVLNFHKQMTGVIKKELFSQIFKCVYNRAGYNSGKQK